MMCKTLKFAFILVFAVTLIPGCQTQNRVQEKKTKTLTSDERYIVELYMKITEIDENLQDNQEEKEKKWAELRQGVDSLRIDRILGDLEKDPERWFAVYNRINELMRRRETNPPPPSN